MAKRKVTQPCKRCGTPFRPRQHSDRGKSQMYCSYACRQAPAYERFWDKVRKSEQCWEWTGGTDRDGYGCFQPMRRAHRFSWYLHNGPIPKGLWVLHRCNNPPCVNPAHLWLGTNADNSRDRDQKGRTKTGITAKLTEGQVRKIRTIYASGKVSQRQLAARYQVDQSNISVIVHRKSWANL